jgi:hypothetical protein
MVNQVTAHDPGSEGKKMPAVTPVDVLGASEANKCLIDQGSGLEGMTRPLAAEAAARNPT